ncbi:medium-chain acyl-CoA ligase ACSF2, mitochondrial-like [Paramacrobiotus metropolitanus]|uniref:medium-chain acyl-CoA ligase ACSF2, mitochondrial-like n=1 Tax=Paramacrobiotus metropolitanus TaxID=2943436 RepID=UPI002445C0D1|nr:medium-chain acyl-CoA ligase ACSF2, mitochondrial-like [Paramacrobiotus metropolitanus]
MRQSSVLRVFRTADLIWNQHRAQLIPQARSLHICIPQEYKKRPDIKLKESYIHQPSEIPYLATTLGRLIDYQAEKIGDQIGYVVSYQNVERTYAQLQQDAEQLASGLLALGLSPGDRLGIWGPNSYEWIVTMFAASKAGLILVNINPAYKVSELEYCLNKVQVKAIVAAEGVATLKYYDHLKKIFPDIEKSDPHKLRSTRAPHLKHVIMMTNRPRDFPGTIPYSEVQKMATHEYTQVVHKINQELQPDAAFNVQFTSGTTGSPKGATLSSFGLMNAAYFSGHRLGAGTESRSIVCPLPLYHVFGCVGNLVLATIFGVKVVFPTEKFEAGATLKAIQDQEGNTVSGVPTMWRDMLDHPELAKLDLTSLKFGVMGGAPCPPELVREAKQKMGIEHFTCGYGSTEQGLSTFVGYLGDPPEVYTTTTGFPLDHVEAKVVDADGKVVPIGMTGELLTRSFGTMLGYWGDQEKTSETIRPDRWMYSGDLATLTVDGYLKIVGRVKDMIIRGGENVYPVEIENVLHECGLVDDVHVCGVPDERMGEEICAWIRLTPGEYQHDPKNREIIEHEMRCFCQKHLANYKTPKYFVFFKSNEDIPMTVTGKVKKFRLTELAIPKLGLDKLAEKSDAENKTAAPEKVAAVN